MARKTAIRTTNAEVRAEEYRADARKDAAPTNRPVPTGLMSLAELRAMRGIMGERDVLRRAQDAARLELRGDKFSADDRADVAAAIVADVLAECGGCPPRADSPRATLTAFCDRAKTLRRSIERQRARDDRAATDDAAAYALSADALGADATPAKHAAIVGRSAAVLAERAASAVCEQLGLPADVDSPAWTLFYVWARNASPEVCAAERDVTHATWRVRQSRGAKFVRGFYGAAELLAKLTLGAAQDAAGDLVYVTADDSSKARDRSRVLADGLTSGPTAPSPGPRAPGERPAELPHWRERQIVAHPVRELRGAKVHHMTARKARGDVAQHTADALRAIGRAHARAGRRERAAKRRSDLRARHADA